VRSLAAWSTRTTGGHFSYSQTLFHMVEFGPGRAAHHLPFLGIAFHIVERMGQDIEFKRKNSFESLP
jgi:hypothetical protein